LQFRNAPIAAAGEPEPATRVSPIEQVASRRLRATRTTAMLKKLIIALAAGGLALGASACNTVKGAGQDLKSASQTTEDAINGK
jgi:entericidin B